MCPILHPPIPLNLQSWVKPGRFCADMISSKQTRVLFKEKYLVWFPKRIYWGSFSAELCSNLEVTFWLSTKCPGLVPWRESGICSVEDVVICEIREQDFLKGRKTSQSSPPCPVTASPMASASLWRSRSQLSLGVLENTSQKALVEEPQVNF